MAQAPTDIISQIDTKIATIITNDISSASDAFNQGINVLNDTLNSLVSGAFDFVENEFAPLKYSVLQGVPNGIEFAARKQVTVIVSDGIKIAVGIYIFSLAMDSVPTLRGATLLEAAVFIQELYGVNKAIDAFNSNIVGAGLAEPLRRWANLQFRSAELDIQTAIDSFYKGNIDEIELFGILAHNGFNNDDANVIIDSSAEPLGISQLIRLAKIKHIDPSYILSTLKKNRFVGDDLANAFTAIQLDDVRTYLDTFVSDIIAEYALGTLPDSVFNNYLTFGLVQGEAIKAVQAIAGIKFQTTLIKQRITILTSAFKQGFMSQAAFQNSLANLQLQPLEANNIFIQALLDVGINPSELLLFPTFIFFMPSGMSFAFSIS